MTFLHTCCQRVLLDHYSDCSARDDVPAVRVRPVRYDVCALPEGHPEAGWFTLHVALRRSGGWAVLHNGAHYDLDGEPSRGWQWEDGRDPATAEERAACAAVQKEWLERHHFTEDAALELASRLALTVTHTGLTVADVLTREAGDA